MPNASSRADERPFTVLSTGATEAYDAAARAQLRALTERLVAGR